MFNWDIFSEKNFGGKTRAKRNYSALSDYLAALVLSTREKLQDNNDSGKKQSA